LPRLVRSPGTGGNSSTRGSTPRDKAEDLRREAERQRKEAERARTNTFKAAFDDFYEEHLRSLRTGDVVKGVIEKHVIRVLGDRPFCEITRAEDIGCGPWPSG
jgi:hypothetical protein